MLLVVVHHSGILEVQVVAAALNKMVQTTDQLAADLGEIQVLNNLLMVIKA
jgi:hypothetical protein